MRCGKPEHQPGQKCAAKNAKCKECHKIGHFYKVCQSKKRAKRANLAQVAPQTEQDTHIDENGVRQPNPPMVNMLKIFNHIGATSGSQEKHLKFPINVDPRGPYKHHLVVRVDTGADVNCIYLCWIDLFSSNSFGGCGGPERSCWLCCIHSPSGIFGNGSERSCCLYYILYYCTSCTVCTSMGCSGLILQ